jgi:hypothetical protein
MSVVLYKILFPHKFRLTFYLFRRSIKRFFLKKQVIKYLDSIDNINDEQIKVLEYLKINPISIFPYDYTNLYNPIDVKVFLDVSNGLSFVLHNERKLYFKKSMKIDEICDYYNSLLIEQDSLSPHCYLCEGFDVDQDSTVVDIGCAEGIFSLSVIDKVSKLYLFETNSEWLEALEETFKPWKNKVVIINRFVGDKITDHEVSLDSFFEDAGTPNFLKIDVDGAEQMVLDGAINILSSNNPIKIALCTYHNQDDAYYFDKLLNQYNFSNTFSSGYMLFLNDTNALKAPFLRRGLIRAKK